MVSVEPDYATDRHISDHIMLTLFTLHARIGVRANIHLGGGGRPSFARMDSVGGGGRPSFARMDSVGGGRGSTSNFPGSIFCGGAGVVAEMFRDPYSVGCQNFFS